MTDVEIALGRDEILTSPALRLMKTSSPDCVTEAPDAYVVLTKQLADLAQSKPTVTPRPFRLRVYKEEAVAYEEVIPRTAPWGFLEWLPKNKPLHCWRFQESLVIYEDRTGTFWVVTRVGRS